MGAFLNAARQMQTIVSQGAALNGAVDGALNGAGNAAVDDGDALDMLEAAVSLATHHDGMSGTERQDVSDDYEQRLSEGFGPAAAAFSNSLAALGSLANAQQCTGWIRVLIHSYAHTLMHSYTHTLIRCTGLNITLCPELATGETRVGTINVVYPPLIPSAPTRLSYPPFRPSSHTLLSYSQINRSRTTSAR
jgi:hypothetical protein